MAETVDELTVTYEDGGIETVKELDKKVLTKGAWATIMYRYQRLPAFGYLIDLADLRKCFQDLLYSFANNGMVISNQNSHKEAGS